MLIYCFCIGQWEEEGGMRVVPSPSDPTGLFESRLRETAAKLDNHLTIDLAQKSL